MKPAPFDFTAPEDMAGVLIALAHHGDDARILAGGQSLVPLMNLRMVRPELLISINRVDALDYIRLEDDYLVLGARVRQAQAEEAGKIRHECPLLAEALPLVGGQSNRNRGTVCGSLAHGDPLAEPPVVALALDAEMRIVGPRGRRAVPADRFFLGALETAIDHDEMLEAVAFERARPGEAQVFLEVGNRAHGFAVAGVALRLRRDEAGRTVLARIAMIGAGETARRIATAEAALLERPLDDDAIAEAVARARAEVDPPGDVHADADHRRHVLGVLLERSLGQLMTTGEA